MQNFINKVTDVLGSSGTDKLLNALIGLVILVVGMFVVKLLAKFFKKLLLKISFFNKKGRDLVDPSVMLVRSVMMIFVLMSVLQHFGLTNVLLPLQNMADSFLNVIPNIIGAGIIVYAGWILASIVVELVKIPLGKLDQTIAKKIGNEEFKLSSFFGTLIFGGILLPIVVAALGVLNIEAISKPASEMIQKLMLAVPNIVGAVVILLVTFFVTRFVIFMLSSLLNSLNINSLPQKLGLVSLFSEKFTFLKLISNTIMFFSMVAAATAAVDILKIEIISSIFARILEFGGGILVGALILIIGNVLSQISYKKLSESGNTGLAKISSFAIIGLVLAMGLKAMGLADSIVTMAFGFTLGSVAFAAALAFGLGGKDAAKKLADKWASKM